MKEKQEIVLSQRLLKEETKSTDKSINSIQVFNKKKKEYNSWLQLRMKNNPNLISLNNLVENLPSTIYLQ